MLQYSLLERFQGALLGAVLESDRLASIHRLITWIDQRPESSCPITLAGQPNHDALLLTPIWLYAHESWRQRQNWLAQISPADSDTAALWLWGETIAQILRPQFAPEHCLLTVLDRWYQHRRNGAPTLPEYWQQALQQTQTRLQQGADLPQIMTDCRTIDPTHRSFRLALFCFLDTPQDSQIALDRVAQTQDHVATNLTAVLLGTHQGWTGFPLPQLWRSPALSPTQDLAIQLLRSWSGQTVIADTSPPIVLAPR